MSDQLTELATRRLAFDAEPTRRTARAYLNLAWALYRDGVVEWDAVKVARTTTAETLGQGARA